MAWTIRLAWILFYSKSASSVTWLMPGLVQRLAAHEARENYLAPDVVHLWRQLLLRDA